MEIHYILTTILLATFVSAQSSTYEYNCNRLNDCQNAGTCGADNTCTCTGNWGNYDCGDDTTNAVCEAPCSNGGTCYTLGDADTCICAYGYRGVACDETDFQVVCSGNTAEFKIHLPTSFAGEVQLRKGAAQADESCVVAEATETDYKLYSIAVDISDAQTGAEPCKKTELDTDDANYYAATLWVRYDAGMTTNLDVVYTGNCSHVLETQMSEDLTSLELDNANLASVKESETLTPVDMVLLDENDDTLTTDTTLYVGSVIKLVTFITDPDVFKKVRFERCVANNTLEPASNQEFVLVDGGCPATKSMRFTREQIVTTYTVEAVDLTAASFTFDAFKFATTNKIGILCTTKVCKEGVNGCDIPADCGAVRTSLITTTVAPTTAGVGRKRRAVEDETLDVTDQEETLSAFITVLGPNDVSDQSENKSGADQLSATVENCFTRSEIFAVVTVLASIVCVLLIACLVLGCLIIKRKAKSTEFESMPADRYRIPRAHVNNAFTLREI